MSQITELTTQLQALVQKVNAFVNGPADAVVPTASGPLKTLAGLSKAMNQIDYIAKVRDFSNLTDLYAEANDLEDGTVARVLLDPVLANRGYYQKDALELNKISYSDLFDLHDRFPDPHNRLLIEVGPEQTIGPVPLFKTSIPPSAAFIAGMSTSGRLEYTSELVDPLGVTDDRFFYSTSFALALAGVEAGSTTHQYATSLELLIGPLGPSTAAELDVVTTVENGNNVFQVRLLPPKDSAGDYIAGKARIVFDYLDTTGKIQLS